VGASGSSTSVTEGAGGAALAVPVTAGRVLVYRRFLRERVAVAALAVLVLIVLACFVLEPVLEHVLGRTPDTPFLTATNQFTHKPVGPWTWVSNEPLDASPSAHPGKTLFLLGADGPLGRDELLRVLAGGRVSLEIALFATLIGLTIGVIFGTIAGWFGGGVDALVSRLTELVMAFPLLLLVIAIGQSVADRFDNITLHGTFEPGVLSLGVVIGFFSWFYPARVCRVLVQELREREFVEAARMIGQSDWRILRKHILPHLLGPVTVWAGLMAASVIVLEAALSSLNFGIRLPTASWGSLLSSTFGNLFNFNPLSGGATSFYRLSNWPLVWPSIALFLTVLCLALVSDGLRSALNPKGDA
jgi:ABC-type dipeptide/oligopeptide/nickel transport system permease subunit